MVNVISNILYECGVNWVEDRAQNQENLAVNFRIGSHENIGTNWFKGSLDEFRISSTIRSSSWLSASYANQNAPGTFIAPPSGRGSALDDDLHIFSDGHGDYRGLWQVDGGAKPRAAGLAISGGPGVTAEPQTFAALGLAISGGYGSETAGPSPAAGPGDQRRPGCDR